MFSVQCVATNATDSDGAKVAEALDRVGLRDHISRFFTSSEMGISKPDPKFFEYVSRELRISPTNLVAVGNDLHKDIVPAKAVGMSTVLVSPDREPALQETADLIVPNLIHFADLLRSGFRGHYPDGNRGAGRRS